MQTQPTAEEIEEAHKGWQQELLDSVKERAKFTNDLPIPDLDDLVFTPQFLQADIKLALQFITTTMKAIRKAPGWKASELKKLKAWRQRLLIESNKVKGMQGLPEEQIKASQKVLQEFYQEQNKPE